MFAGFFIPPPCVRRTRKTKFCIRVTLLESVQRAFARRKPLQPFILPPTPLLRLIRWGSASATRLRAGAALALSRVHSILPEVIEWTCPLSFFYSPHRKTSNASIRNYGGSSPLNPTRELSGPPLFFLFAHRAMSGANISPFC